MMICDEAGEVIEELFYRYQIGLETSRETDLTV